MADESFNGFLAETIYPALSADLEKYAETRRVLIRETPELYQKIKEKHILTQDPQHKQWIYNIFSHEKEVENILFEDEEIIIIKDYRTSLERQNFRLLVFPLRRDLYTLRDLGAENLQMLLDVRPKVFQVVEKHLQL